MDIILLYRYMYSNVCFDCFQLIGGLADEKVRRAESVANFDIQLTNVIGDVMVSAGVVAYQGAFTVSP